ncbi:MAG: ABC transporter ATP-binding protein, partial [bacterium]
MTEQEALRAGTGYRQNSWKAFGFVLPYLKPHLSRVIAICAVDLSITLINLVIPWLGKFIIDVGFAAHDWTFVLRIALVVAGISLGAYALSGLRTYLYNATDMLLGLDLRRAMYGHIQRLSLDTVEGLPIGQLQFRVTTDSDRIAHMLVRILPTCTMLVEFGLLLAAAVYVDPLMTAVVLGFLVPWTIAFVWVTHYGRVLDRRRLRFVELRDAGVLQAAASFVTIKALGRSRREVRRHTMVSHAAQRVANQGYLILVFFEFATQKMLPYLKQTTIFLYLARKVVLGEMTLGTTAPMIAYLGRLTYPIERITNFACWIWQT